MARRRRGKKKELEGALGLKISTPRSIPTFQKLNSVLLKDMEEEEKASQSPRPQRSKLHLWGCSGVSFKAWQAEPYSRYKHIYILKPFHLFLLWLYNIPWWPDMAAECYTESWRDIKMKKNKKKRKKKKWWNCPWRRGREGGGFDGGGSCFVAVCGTSCCSPLSPLKMLHTLVKHTVSPSHCCSDLLWGGLKKKKKNRFRREKEDCTYNRIL